MRHAAARVNVEHVDNFESHSSSHVAIQRGLTSAAFSEPLEMLSLPPSFFISAY